VEDQEEEMKCWYKQRRYRDYPRHLKKPVLKWFCTCSSMGLEQYNNCSRCLKSHWYGRDQPYDYNAEVTQLRSINKRSGDHLLPYSYCKKHVRYISASSETELRLNIQKVALKNAFILLENFPVWGDVLSNPKVMVVSKQESAFEEKKEQTNDEVDDSTQGEEEEEDEVEWPVYNTFRPLQDGSIIMIDRSILHRDLKTTNFQLYKRKIERSKSRHDAYEYTDCTNYNSERCGFLKKPEYIPHNEEGCDPRTYYDFLKPGETPFHDMIIWNMRIYQEPFATNDSIQN
jgi:hypothetical protein